MRVPAAYHEAGHAIVLLALKRGVVKVTIRADGSGAVRKQGIRTIGEDGELERRQRPLVEDHAVASLAGPVAERRFTNGFGDNGGDGDEQAARRQATWARTFGSQAEEDA